MFGIGKSIKKTFKKVDDGFHDIVHSSAGKLIGGIALGALTGGLGAAALGFGTAAIGTAAGVGGVLGSQVGGSLASASAARKQNRAEQAQAEALARQQYVASIQPITPGAVQSVNVANQEAALETQRRRRYGYSRTLLDRNTLGSIDHL